MLKNYGVVAAWVKGFRDVVEVELPTGHGAEDEERFLPVGDFVWQGCICWTVRPVFFTCVKPHERSSLLGTPIANRSDEHGKSGFDFVNHAIEGYRRLDV
jgi:hypothetical protein